MIIIIRKDRRIVRKTLKQIEAVLLLDSPASVVLWDIMAALRGPDAGGSKSRSTNHIRHMAFPLAMKDNGRGLPISVARVYPFAPDAQDHNSLAPSDHFVEHVKRAHKYLTLVAKD